MQLLALGISERPPAIFGAKYQMDGVSYEGLRHSRVALTGLGHYCKSHSRASARGLAPTRAGTSGAFSPDTVSENLVELAGIGVRRQANRGEENRSQAGMALS